MSTKRRAKRPAAGAVAPAPAPALLGRPAQTAGATRPAVPQYHWRQFPVYFALAFGLFLGFEGGVLVSSVESSLLTTAISAVVAVLLGFGVARLAVVWMISRNWVKPRPKRR